MENAKDELILHTRNKSVILVRLVYKPGVFEKSTVIEGTLDKVLPMLDFQYDSGYGGQRLFGYIWYAYGTWSEREEYDGSEWWAHKKCPEHNVDIEV